MTSYLLKAISCSGVLLLAYHLFLEKEKMLRFNRFYLLFAIVFSFGIPLVTVQTTTTPIVDEILVSINTGVDTQNTSPIASQRPQNLWPNVLLLIYIGISVVMCFRFGRNLLVVLLKAVQNEKTNFENAKVVLLDQETTPHSFLTYVFVAKQDFEQGKIAPQILQHELTHVRQKHSIDILLIEITLIFAWVNPILFRYRKAIQLNHEFLADESAADSHNIKEYQLLLVNEPCSSERHKLYSSFNYSFTKKRLIMMTKKTSIRTALVKELALLPLIILCAFAFGGQAIAQQIKKVNKQTQESAQQTQKVKPEPQKAAKQLQKKIQQPKKEVQAYVSVGSTADAKTKTTPNAQTWTLKQDGRTMRFKSTEPLTDAEKKVVEDDFVKNLEKPFPKFPPTQAQLDSFSDGAMYGVWINGKRAYNWELKLYSAKDFSEVWVSPLMQNAKDYGKYLFHVDLKKKDGC